MTLLFLGLLCVGQHDYLAFLLGLITNVLSSKMFPSFENVSLTCLISFLVSVSVRVVCSLSCSPWLVFVSVFSPSLSTTSAALPVGRQHVLLACQISHTFLMCVVVCKFRPTVIIVVSRQPIGCMLRELFPNISQGP